MSDAADAETIAELVAAGRDREGAVISVPERATDYSYAEFCTGVWKSGNLLRHYGLREGADSAVAVGPKAGDGDSPWRGDERETDKKRLEGWPDSADPLLATLGAGVLGAPVDLTPPSASDSRTLVLPAGWVDRYDPAPGCSVLAYGGPPGRPGVAHFERERWSENPIEPPDPAGPGVPFVGGLAQGELLDAAASVVEKTGIGSGDRLALCAPLRTAGAVAAGLLAPMLVGATAVLAGPDCTYEGAVAAVIGSEGDVDPAAIG